MEKTVEIQLKEQRETIALQIEEMNFGFPADATSEGKLAVYEFLRIVADYIRDSADAVREVVEEEEDDLQTEDTAGETVLVHP